MDPVAIPTLFDLLTRSLSRNGDLGSLDGRAVIFERAIPSVALTIFDGAHEMLPNYCFARLQELAEEISTPPHFTDHRHSDSGATALATN